MLIEDILKCKCAKQEGKATIAVDYCLLNNDEAIEAAMLMKKGQQTPLDAKKVLVIQDQVIPPNSPETSSRQQILMEFAEREKTQYFYGTGMASHILLNEYVKSGDVVVGSDADVLMVGAKGAMGIRVDAAELAQTVSNGKTFIPEPAIFRIRLTGCLPENTDIRAAAMMLSESMKEKVDASTVIEFYPEESEGLGEHEKAILCGWMQKTGAMSSLIAQAECANPDYIFNLAQTINVISPCEESKAVLAETLEKQEIRVVFIGGAYGGYLKDIEKTAELLRGRKVSYKVRLVVAPATSEVYAQAADRGYLTDIIKAGGMIINQCGNPAVQARIGVGEVMVSNDKHNESGYAGPKSSRIFLTTTLEAVQCALKGTIGGR